ncbi:MAG: NUMOD3 domain-containing DNA-binding protein [Candidatus Heimdallarchaeaceae archaeon]
MKIKYVCPNCNKTFYAYKCNNPKFCSRKCYDEWQKKYPHSVFKKGHKSVKYWLGKKRSKETKRKISKSHKGKIPWNKGKKGIYICSEETKEKMRKSAFKYAQKVIGIICPRIGRNETKKLDELEKELKLRIIRQYKIGGYYLDGYIPEINLAIEVDEKHHKNQKEKDIQREEFIKQKLGCKFLRIKDYE